MRGDLYLQVDQGLISDLAGNIWVFIPVLLSLAVGFSIAVFIKLLMKRTLHPRIPLHIYKALEKIVLYSILIVTVIAALAPLGLDISTLLLTGGVIGVALGFASQSIVSNALSGVFIYTERIFKIGDPIRVENIEGRVIDITTFSTIIRCWDGYIARVPNNKVFDNILINYEKAPIRRIALNVGIAYGVDIDKARKLIMDVMEDHPYILVNPGPEVYVDEFGDSAVVLKVRCWAPSQVWFDVRKYLLEAIKKIFDREGVEIPFPQRVIWIREG